MKKAIFISILWLMPVQVLHGVRLQNYWSLLKPNSAQSTFLKKPSFTAAYFRRAYNTQPTIFTQAKQTNSNTSWRTKFSNAWHNFFARFKQSKTQSNSSTLNNAAAFSVGVSLGLYTLHDTRISSVAAAETLAISWDEIKDPIKLSAKIENTPDQEKPALAITMIRYLATYLDSYHWRWALSGAISTYPDIAHIIVHFLIQYPLDITHYTTECVPVVKFLMTHDKSVSDPIKHCVAMHKAELKKTAYGPDIIALVEQHATTEDTNTTSRVINC